VKQAKKNTSTKKMPGIQIRINKSLDKYTGKVLFPEKLAKANRLLKGVKVP
jgi:hypothetical protein